VRLQQRLKGSTCLGLEKTNIYIWEGDSTWNHSNIMLKLLSFGSEGKKERI